MYVGALDNRSNFEHLQKNDGYAWLWTDNGFGKDFSNHPKDFKYVALYLSLFRECEIG